VTDLNVNFICYIKQTIYQNMYYVKTYKDTLRQLKKENEEKEKKQETKTAYELVPTAGVFTPYIYDLSDESLLPYEPQLLYKKTHDKFHDYEIPLDLIESQKRKKNFFDDVKKYIVAIIKDRLIDCDYMTGYFIAKQLLMIKSKKTKIFLAGLTKDNILFGIRDVLEQKKNKTSYIGCDAVLSKTHKKNYCNGISKQCNIHDINSVLSINIEMGEKLSANSIDLYVADVHPNNTYDVLCSYLIQYGFTSKTGTIIMRIPNNWKDTSTSMITLILYFISEYKSVRIFKTPWGSTPKYYIILFAPKNDTTAQRKTCLISYTKELKQNPNLPLFKDVVFDDSEDEDQHEDDGGNNDNEDIDSENDKLQDGKTKIIDNQTNDEIKEKQNTIQFVSNIETLIDNISNTYKQLMTYDEKYTNDQIRDIWMDLIKD
jgi:hypothetical protein